MSKEELIKKLKVIKKNNSHDPEKAGSLADELLLEYIGDEKVTNAYNNIYKY